MRFLRTGRGDDRLSDQHSDAVQPSASQAVAQTLDVAEAEDIVDRWRRETGLLDAGVFALRLETDGLDAAGLQRRLASWQDEPGVLPAECTVQRIDASSPAASTSARQPCPPPWSGWSGEEARVAPLLALVEPAVAEAEALAWQQLLELSALHPGCLDAEALFACASSALRRAALTLVSRAAVIELNRADAEGQLGAGAESARFHYFIEEFAQGDGRTNLHNRYPLLQDLLQQRLEQTRAAVAEVHARFAADRGALAQWLPTSSSALLLTGVDMGRGDRHGDGRTVAILTLADGSRLVYKPRSMAVEVAYFNLVAWLNQAGLEPAQKTVAVLDRGAYGYMEFVPAALVADTADATRYYRRLGALIAVMHLLSGTDLHHENIIASGAYPVPVDLETLLHPILPSRTNDDGRLRMSYDTVLWSQLLPTGGAVRAGQSGVGGLYEQARSVTGRTPVNAGTSRLRYGVGEVAVEPSSNLPLLDGQVVSPWEHVASIVAGFRDAYDLMLRSKPAFRGDSGPLQAFRGVTCRVVLRGTRVYASLLHGASHPRSLGGRIEVERLFERLWLMVAEVPRLASCVAAERRALWRGDVPRFHVRSDEVVVRDCFGKPLSSYFRRSGWDGLRQRLRMFCVRDRERQVHLIEQSIHSLRPVEAMPCWSLDHYPDPAGAARVDNAVAVAAAVSLAERLLGRRFRDGRNPRWLRAQLGNDGYQGLSVPGADLYDGLPGIALFLAQLAVRTGTQRYRRFAGQLVDTSRRAIESGALSGAGAFDGLAGWMYALGYLSELWQEPALADEAVAVLPKLRQAIAADDVLDLIGGSAGAIWCLLGLYRQLGDEALLKVARECGDHLLSRAQAMDTGIGWLTRSFDSVALTGVSHGASGFAVALAWLGGISGEERYEQAARDAIAYERTTFDARSGAWHDLRDDRRDQSGAQGRLHAWCHGGPGITMARLCLPERHRDRQWTVEVEAGVRNTMAHGFGVGHCLCHGDLGNLDMLIEAERQGVIPADLVDWRRRATQIVERLAHGPRCGAHIAIDSPGLMTGIAGIGYGLLRCADPHAVPSVLALQLPDKGAQSPR